MTDLLNQKAHLALIKNAVSDAFLGTADLMERLESYYIDRFMYDCDEYFSEDLLNELAEKINSTLNLPYPPEELKSVTIEVVHSYISNAIDSATKSGDTNNLKMYRLG